MLPNGPYNPQEYEKEILDYYLSNKLYKPEYDPDSDKVLSTDEMKKSKRDSWALICPPPNAYARPHIGNISGYAYQDAMARYARMQGKKVLVLPGKDHAGLEGEGVFVREVLEKQGRNKFDMKREDFYKEMMEFFMKNIDIARNDEKSIGLSADFDRDTFTLDPDIVEIVLDTFVEMFKEGRIYKGVRIVNWDPKARTAVADNQVEYKEAQTPFFYFKYAFTEPEQKALELKKAFEGKGLLWKVKTPNDEISYLTGENHKGVKVLGIGYDKVPVGTEVAGEVIGIQMRLDGDFHLVVKSNDFEGDLQPLLEKADLDMFKQAAGSHIILFADYPEDKFYTNGFILGTVRPETKFGDTAIAVNPKDERYKDFVGKKIKVRTLIGEAELNIISDYAVDPEFGTGAVKVTPAHSQADWEIAQRHPKECLPPKQVIGYDLKLNHLTGKYEGLNIKQAREAMRTDLQKEGLLVFVDDTYQNRIQIAERTKAPIEPLLSSQWYLKYDGLKEAAIKMVEKGEVQIHPESMVSKFNHWMENLRDWAISRSLWWGYRMPVWYAGKVTEEIGNDGQVKEYIEIDGKKEELDYKNPEHIRVQKQDPSLDERETQNVERKTQKWIQDDNVLDTWFSSGQWVYATLTKWNLMDTFFPTDVLVSASDILENWDSRMMMFTYFKYKNVPFKNLFLTGLVLGSDGQKMSKSRGNIVDMDKIRAEYGTDSIRMAYFYQNRAGGSYVISNDKLKNFKQFNNKLWNAARFVLMHSEENPNFKFQIPKPSTKLGKEIIDHITQVKEKVTKNIEAYEFGYATETLYQEFWHTFCDKIIEESKPYLTTPNTPPSLGGEKGEVQQALLFTLKEYLKMLHPFIPFITEKIWQEVPKSEGDNKTLMYSKW